MYKHTLNVHDVERIVRRVQYVNVGKNTPFIHGYIYTNAAANGTNDRTDVRTTYCVRRVHVRLYTCVNYRRLLVGLVFFYIYSTI